MKKSNFVSPVYGSQSIKIDQIVSQRLNDNSQTGPAWQALVQSIFNTGYTFPVVVGINSDYDPSTEGQEVPSLIDSSDGDKSTLIGGVQMGSQVSDDEIAKYFKYRLVDGSHRSMVVRLGKYFFENGHDNSENWAKGIDIPTEPDEDMVAYIAWREHFSIPAVILDMDEDKQASSTALLNRARGTHSLDSMKDVVYELVMVANMSPEWVSRNLFLDVSSIKRMIQMVGLRMVVLDENGGEVAPDLTWAPEKTKRYKKMRNGYITMDAIAFNEKWARDHNEPAPEGRGDAKAIAESHGWSFDSNVRAMAESNKRIKE